jgi:hypothetical protein
MDADNEAVGERYSTVPCDNAKGKLNGRDR